MECQIKVDKVLTGPEAADFLRRLADGLEKNKLMVGDTAVDMRLSIQIEESLDVKGNQVAYDLKVIHRNNAESEPAEAPAPEEAPVKQKDIEPSLKKLKKRMAKSFKAVLDVLQEGELPRLDQVGAFCADADIMISVMDKAQENFPAFKAKCRDLLGAVEHGNLDNAIDTAGDINQMRRDCHAKYKRS
jgi:XXXCH domain-containing protein